MNNFFAKRIELWLVGMIVVLMIIAMFAFGAIVRHHATGGDRFGLVGRAANKIAAIPSEAARAAEMLLSGDLAGMSTEHSDRFPGRSGWIFFDTRIDSGLDGYLFFSRHDGDVGHHVLEMVDLKAGETVHRIDIDATELFAGSQPISRFAAPDDWRPERFQVVHPLAMDNGDILIKGLNTPIVRMSPCGSPIWVTHGQSFHHTTEPGPDGTFWSSAFIEEPQLKGLHPYFNDPGITQFSEDGEILYNRSLTAAMIEQGLGHMILADQDFYIDPLHLNDVEPVFEDGPYWKRGDVFISLRHISTVMLFRPSTDEIIWWKQGPWAAQHDVDIIDATTISIYNNNAFNYGSGVFVDEVTHINYYDFATDTVTSPFEDSLRRNEVKNEAAGLFTLLPGGHYYVDESESGRTLIFTPHGELAAEHVNRAENGLIYHLGWSRYMERTEGDMFVANLKAANCEL